MSSKIVFITSYPPRECGIATYSRDLIRALRTCSHVPFDPVVCALEPDGGWRPYGAEVHYTLRAVSLEDYADMAAEINGNRDIHGVFIQHEFGLFGGDYGDNLLLLLYHLHKPAMITFHTVLPSPNDQLRKTVHAINQAVDKIVVMTNNAADLLVAYYGIQRGKIAVIPHGIHKIPAETDKLLLRRRHGLSAYTRILTTFGFLSRGKSIETALRALPSVIDRFPDTLYLIIGETHPEIVRREGEEYRDSLNRLVGELGLGNHVRFIDRYMPTDELLEYLALSDIYLFTSKDPNQAVSGTFAYALSCGCPMVSTPIPHAREVLTEDIGVLVGFEQPGQFAAAIMALLAAPQRLQQMSGKALQVMASSTWGAVAKAHYEIFDEMKMLPAALPGESSHGYKRRLPKAFRIRTPHPANVRLLGVGHR